MKKIFLILTLILAVNVIHSQTMTPDGYVGKLSFKLHGIFNNGTYDSDNTQYDFDTEFDFRFDANMPLSETLTIGAFYETYTQPLLAHRNFNTFAYTNFNSSRYGFSLTFYVK